MLNIIIFYEPRVDVRMVFRKFCNEDLQIKAIVNVEVICKKWGKLVLNLQWYTWGRN